MSKMIQFAKTSGIYFIGQISSKLIAFFLLPFYTRLISPDEFGYYDLVLTILNFATPVVCFNIWSSALRFLFDFDTEEGKRSAVKNSFVIFLGGVILYSVLFLSMQLLTPIKYAAPVYIYGLCSMLQLLYSFIARGFSKNTLFMVSGIVNSLINFALSYLFIVCFSLPVYSLFFAGASGCAVQAVIIEWNLGLLRLMKTGSVQKPLIKAMLRYGAPLSLNVSVVWLLSGLNRVVVTGMLGSAENGYYGVVVRFTTILTLIVTVFTFAWQELAFSLHKDSNKMYYYNLAIQSFQRFIGAGALLLIPFTFLFFPLLIGGSYSQALAVLPYFYLSTFLSSMSDFLGNIFSAEKKTSAVLFSSLGGAAINVILLFLLIPSLGLLASAVSLSVGFALICLVRILLLRKMMSFRYDYLYFILFLILFAVSTFVFSSGSVLYNILWGILLGVLSLLLLIQLIRKKLPILSKREK